MLLLASSSPRRSALLAAAGIDFAIVAPGPEPRGHGGPADLAILRARSKAAGASATASGALVLGVDTVVDLDGVELAKPADATAAESMLRRLAGRTHCVHTAHTLIQRSPDGDRPLERLASSRVRCADLTDQQIAAFVASRLWVGKAGGYGIQDPECDFMTLVAGDLDTVVGLSLAAVDELLQRAGCPRR